MTGKGYAAKRTDANHADIVRDLRALGYSVHSTHELGDGFPDIVVGHRETIGNRETLRNFLFEIKNPKKPPSARRLSPDETLWHMGWGGQVDVIHSATEAVAIMEGQK